MHSRQILIIDYGLGNISSVINSVNQLGFTVRLASDSNFLLGDLAGFILPGVGAFAHGMRLMAQSGFDALTLRLIDKGVKGIGICLGLQLLASYSDEGGERRNGLGYFQGGVTQLNDEDASVPHIGWTKTIASARSNQLMPLLNGNFYYVHSYALAPDSPDVVATFRHGSTDAAAACLRDNVLGVQFHPEKSQHDGLALLNGFLISQE